MKQTSENTCPFCGAWPMSDGGYSLYEWPGSVKRKMSVTQQIMSGCLASMVDWAEHPDNPDGLQSLRARMRELIDHGRILLHSEREAMAA